MAKRLLLLGGGGHCKSIIDSLLDNNEFEKIGIIEKVGNSHESINGIPVVGCDDDLAQLKNDGYTDAFISLGSVGNTQNRRMLFNLISSLGFSIPNIIDRSATVSSSTVLAKGIFIGKHVVINADSRISDCTIINSSSVIEHDCMIGEYVHISPGAIICGEVSVEANTHIGAGSVVKQQIRIGQNVMIGMGSIVLNDVPDNSKAYGNPCKVVTNLWDV